MMIPASLKICELFWIALQALGFQLKTYTDAFLPPVGGEAVFLVLQGK